MSNLVILSGNLGRDPEIRTVGNGSKVATFSMATTKTFKKQNGEREQKTQWHTVVFWNVLANVVEKYLKKGEKVLIHGEIEYESYEKAGVRKDVTKILGTYLEILSTRQQGNRDEMGGHGADDDDTPDFLK